MYYKREVYELIKGLKQRYKLKRKLKKKRKELKGFISIKESFISPQDS
jgi:hypothetical protein